MNSFGRLFRISIFGESHGDVIGVVIDGCPPGIPIRTSDFDVDLNRRKSGKKGTTPRVELDIPEILSGVFNDFSTGAPITIIFRNSNVRSNDYSFRAIPRPGHADFVAIKKYTGFADYRGGGHFSGRLTIALVAAGTIAKKIIAPINIKASLIEAGGITDIEKAVNEAIEKKDSIGGIIECVAENMPVGLGEPFFDSVESCISHLIFAIPAIKGIEFGSGFNAAKMSGSVHNDMIMDASGKTSSNHAGGINGGITNGNDLIFRAVVKPTSSIPISQATFNLEKNELDILEITGRHDVCIALRVPVVIEAVTAIVITDFLLINKSLRL